jgi:hypothetical protein
MQLTSIAFLAALASFLGSHSPLLAVSATAVAAAAPEPNDAVSLPLGDVLFKRSADPLPAADALPVADDSDDPEEELDVVDVDADDAGHPSLVPRAPTACGNKGLIKRVKKEYKGACNPKNSKGFRSSHNCPGKTYLCVLRNKATCYKSLKGLNFEKGECFL